MAKRKRPKSEITREKRLANIDRFAGSSEEEDEIEEPMKEAAEDASGTRIEDDDDDEQKQLPEKDDDESSPNKESSDESDDDDQAAGNAMDDSSASDDGEVLTESAPAASGMANAMARILSTKQKSSGSSNTVVLSKTKTPLQLQAIVEAQEIKALKSRRRANREKRLTALHVPERYGDDAELERYHRRVATRGVVALFNAISVHQQPKSQEQQQPATAAAQSQLKNDATKKLDKDKFLAMIKQRAEEAAAEKPATEENKSTLPPVQKVKWDALSDGFKVVSKKKWDEESSSDEENPDKELVPVEED